MKFLFFGYLCLITLLPLAANSETDQFSENKQTATTESYEQVLARIKKDKQSLKTHKIDTDSCRLYLLDQFENYVFPHWIGTKWDYNGYTNRPGKDAVIACGYFVSTTLKHIGFNWNRYDLAKMYSFDIVTQTCSDIQKLTTKTDLITSVLALPDNLYIVGLDSHVGFILKRGDLVWFIHSNYYGSVGPEKELASVSPALDSSLNYYIGTFLNAENIAKWLNGTGYTFTK